MTRITEPGKVRYDITLHVSWRRVSPGLVSEGPPEHDDTWLYETHEEAIKKFGELVNLRLDKPTN